MARYAVYKFLTYAGSHAAKHVECGKREIYGLLKAIDRFTRNSGLYDMFLELGLYLKSEEGLKRVLITIVVVAIASSAIAWYKSSTKEARRARKLKQLLACRKEVKNLISDMNCNPLMLRMAWAEACSYDRTIRDWPRCGGVTGSLQYAFEYDHANNKGLSKAYVMLLAIKARYRSVSWADLFQMAGALGVELAGGPKIGIRYGRLDARSRPMEELDRGMKPRYSLAVRQPKALPPYPDGAPSADVHIRNAFFRMGFTTKEIVALCGAHTIGRAFKNRSGVCPFVGGDQGVSKYTQHTSIAKANGVHGIGMPGGMPWTKNWLQFDNSYFKRPIEAPVGSLEAEDLLWLPTDQALHESPEFRTYFFRYAADQSLFFEDYAAVHRKMSELGSVFDPPEGIYLPDDK